MSSPNYDCFTYLQIPFDDILSATNNFEEENIICKNGFCKEYKGRLLWSGELIDITARRLNKERDDEAEQQFWTEISLLSTLNHKNLVSLVGFCDESDEKIIIIRRQMRGSLTNYLSDSMLMTWVRRLEISVGLAHALSYIHYDEQRDFSIIHRNICSAIVQLNDDWEPKLSDFESSMKIKASERHLSFDCDTLQYTKGYLDPSYIETKSVSHKSDMYCFGVLLFELLCGREAVIPEQDNKYLAPVAIFHYKKKIIDDIIDPDLWKQMDPESCNVFTETAYSCLNEERSQRPNIDEIVTRLEKALELQLERENAERSRVAEDVKGTPSNQDEELVTFKSTGVESHASKKTNSSIKDLSSLKLSYEDIASVTNNFSDENFIGEFRLAMIFKGRLLHSGMFIDVIVKRFNSDYAKDESKMFWTEISILSSLKHRNLVSLLGFSDSKNVKIIVYKKEANKSLEEYLDDQTLTWMQRLKISLGLASALSYIHYDDGRDFSVIHCNIRSSEILLDDRWEPKLSGFEFAMKNTVARRHRLLLTRNIVKNEYLDPKYKKTGGLTHKSDVYSFGVVLFELLCARSAVSDEEFGEGLLSQLAESHLHDMIEPYLRKQMDPESFKIFSETAYYCLKEERADRPHIDQVVKRLEKALELQWKHENPIPAMLQEKSLEHLKIRLNDIKLATNDFTDAYCIGSGGFGTVYKAQLEHFDISNSLSLEGVNKYDLPKKRSTVAIKQITNPQGEQGFLAEIEILAGCKHVNIVSLLGFCYEGPDHMFLVYEHASNGSLKDYLGSNVKRINLTWVQRIKICLGIANGLNYIHTNTDQGKQKIIHCDIKSANILLGDNWEAKITDFGLSKFLPRDQEDITLDTKIAGTKRYMDPEYQKYGRLNMKSDIYSFGVVLLEILTGRLAHDPVYTNVNEKGIAPIARYHFEKGTLMEIVDYKIKEERDEHVFSLSKGPNKESLDIYSEIAFRCLAETQVRRPSIDVVINELNKALIYQQSQ